MSTHATIAQTCASIEAVDQTLAPKIQARLDALTKPPGSLGQLEALVLRYQLARGQVEAEEARHVLFSLAADHGIVEEGVSAYPAAVTPAMVRNMLEGGAAISVLTRRAGIEHVIVDIGVAAELPAHERLRQCKLAHGTRNFAREPAMELALCEQAVAVGIELAQEAAEQGATLIGTGEMGIGNTSAASALMAALLPADVGSLTGRGTGLDDTQLAHKRKVLEQAVQLHATRLNEPMEALACVGGLEIAGLTGLVLGACAQRIPCMIDGFIASAAALAACRLQPACSDYLFYSHLSAEAGHQRFAQALNIRPILDLGLRLGEGTGAALAMPILESALSCYREMATFKGAAVPDRV